MRRFSNYIPPKRLAISLKPIVFFGWANTHHSLLRLYIARLRRLKYFFFEKNAQGVPILMEVFYKWVGISARRCCTPLNPSSFQYRFCSLG